jgi:hypothetical protein
MSTCESEAVTVAPVSPTIATKLSADEVVVGTSVHDSATLTGATSDAGGTATYTYYTNNTCVEREGRRHEDGNQPPRARFERRPVQLGR